MLDWAWKIGKGKCKSSFVSTEAFINSGVRELLLQNNGILQVQNQ